MPKFLRASAVKWRTTSSSESSHKQASDARRQSSGKGGAAGTSHLGRLTPFLPGTDFLKIMDMGSKKNGPWLTYVPSGFFSLFASGSCGLPAGRQGFALHV